ncbi:MAG: hypothetical protein DCC65_00355 [Planctomycetota bacterium]|nr:MAG: hypothetical protein DCC65_00355 [Planctomycetota bacterium]
MNAFIVSLVGTTIGLHSQLVSQAGPADAILYRAILVTPGGELPFGLEISRSETGQFRAWVINGEERIEVPSFSVADRQATFAFPHYESEICAKLQLDNPNVEFKACKSMVGTWTKSTRDGSKIAMPFHCETARDTRFKPVTPGPEGTSAAKSVDGKWRVKFSSSEDHAIGVFKQTSRGVVDGTFLTNGGDYRYLAGSYEHGLLRLSCFDGSHAFLFHARMQVDGTLKGDFWSGAKWHETWTAVRDESAQLADGFSLAKWKGKADFSAMKFKDLDGIDTAVQSAVDGGKAVLIEVFGSWCPNCHDASAYLVELDRKYRSRGLRILGLAFEYSGRFERDATQVKHFAKRHGVTYPLFVAGKADKAEAAAKLPMLERVPAYPSFVFARPDGTIVAVYSGFCGPATGEEYEKLKRRFEREIESLLGF